MCTSGDPLDLAVTDNIAASVLEELGANLPDRIRQQYDDNIRWIREAGKHKMVRNLRGNANHTDGKDNSDDFSCGWFCVGSWIPG